MDECDRTKASTSRFRVQQNSRRSRQAGVRSSISPFSVACITTIGGEQPPDPRSLALPEYLERGFVPARGDVLHNRIQ
jgi:hypothetical protein